MRVTTNLNQKDDYHCAKDLNAHNIAIAAALGKEVVTGAFDMQQLYAARQYGFIELMKRSYERGLDVGWSKRHDDGELCFGGEWGICWITSKSGKQARYHYPLQAFGTVDKLEHTLGKAWNGKEETIATLYELAE